MSWGQEGGNRELAMLPHPLPSPSTHLDTVVAECTAGSGVIVQRVARQQQVLQFVEGRELVDLADRRDLVVGEEQDAQVSQLLDTALRVSGGEGKGRRPREEGSGRERGRGSVQGTTDMRLI